MANGSVPIVGQQFGAQVANMLAGPQRDPFQMIKDFQQIRNTQAEYQARLDIGQILATSQNPQDAQNRIAQSPAFAFAPAVGPAYAHMQQSMVATAGQRDDQYDNAMDRLIKYSSNIRTAAATNDPEQINGAIDDVRQRYLAGINDPVVRARSAGAFEDYITAIKHGAVQADGSYDGGKLATNIDGQMLPFVTSDQWQAMRGYHYVTPGGMPVPGAGGALPPGQGVATGYGGALPPPGDRYGLTPPGMPGAGAGDTTTTAPPVTPAPSTGVERTELPPPGAPPAPPTGGAGALAPPSPGPAPGGAMPLGPSPPTGAPPAPPTGASPPSAPPAAAAAPAGAASATPPTENIMKEGNRLAMELGRSMYGQARVAGTTVQFEARTVPGLENTYLGDRMMIENLRAVANRTMDQYKFRYRWQQLTNGDLNGSDIAFNDAHGPETDADAVLQKFGVPEGGFTPDAAGRRNLRNAVQNRQITIDDAKQLAEALHIPLPGQ